MSMILGCFMMWIDAGGLPSVCSFVLRSCVRFQGELGKSEMIPVGVVDDIGALAQFLGCRVGPLAALYLGLLWASLLNQRQCGTQL